MSSRLPPIYFYIPEPNLLYRVPTQLENYWQDLIEGVQAWILQTYWHLTIKGFPCQLVSSLPDEGIVLAHRKSLPNHLPIRPSLLLVCIQADKGRHPHAQLHVVQNPQLTRVRLLGDRYLLAGKNYYMPHWTQPGLIPRSPWCGDRFENIACFGLEKNLAPQLREPAWQKQLNDLGLRWRIVNKDQWNNYSDVDGVLAVRDFNKPAYAWDYKPPTKLFNAWHAGVPAILGCESAYQAERKSELDYLEVSSTTDIIWALKRLQNDRQLRRAMVKNGQIRAQETLPAKLTERWICLITEAIVPAYQRWCNNSWYRQTFWQRRQLARQTLEQRKALYKLRNHLGIRSRLKWLMSK